MILNDRGWGCIQTIRGSRALLVPFHFHDVQASTALLENQNNQNINSFCKKRLRIIYEVNCSYLIHKAKIGRSIE